MSMSETWDVIDKREKRIIMIMFFLMVILPIFIIIYILFSVYGGGS